MAERQNIRLPLPKEDANVVLFRVEEGTNRKVSRRNRATGQTFDDWSKFRLLGLWVENNNHHLVKHWYEENQEYVIVLQETTVHHWILEVVVGPYV